MKRGRGGHGGCLPITLPISGGKTAPVSLRPMPEPILTQCSPVCSSEQSGSGLGLEFGGKGRDYSVALRAGGPKDTVYIEKWGNEGKGTLP